MDHTTDRAAVAATDLLRIAWARARSWADRAGVLAALPAYLTSRAVLVVVTVLAATLPDSGSLRAAGHPGVSLADLLDRWRFWDGAWYADIAAGGYARPALSAWFPALPLAERVASLGQPALLLPAGLQIGNASTFAACCLLARLAGDLAGRGPDDAPVVVLLVSPFAFFLAAAYTEGPFLALAAWALLAMRRRSFAWAALACALATATRPVGLALLAPLLYEYARAHGWRLDLRRALVAFDLAIFGTAGLGAYAIYCAARFGDPLAWAHAEATYHGHALTWPWQTAALVAHQLASVPALSYPQVRQLLDIVPLVVALAATLALARRTPVAFTLYSLGVLLPAILSPDAGATFPDALVSGGRYALIALPLWLALGRAVERRPQLHSLVVGGGYAMQATLCAFVLRGGWLV